MMFTTKTSRESRRVREAARSTRQRRHRFFGCDELEDRVVPAAFVIGGTPGNDVFQINVGNNGGMTWAETLNGTANYSGSFTAGSYDSIVIITGGGTNSTYVYGTNIPVYINNGGTNDFNSIGANSTGNSKGVSSILANVTCTNTSGGFSRIWIDDTQNSSASRKVTISDNSVTGVGNGVVYFNENQISELGIFSGSRRNDYSVTDTPYNSAVNPTTSIYNSDTGNNVFWVTGTSGPLKLFGEDGFQLVNVGTDILGNRLTTASINGSIEVRDSTNGWSQLLIDNGTSNTAQTVNINKGTITGIAPATIYFDTNTTRGSVVGGVYSLAVTGAQGSTYNVRDVGSTTNSINTGTGWSTVNVLGTHGDLALYKSGTDALDTINVGSGGSLAGITGNLQLPGGKCNVIMDNSADTIARTVNFDVNLATSVETISGLTSSNITFENVRPESNLANFLAILNGNGESRYYINNTNKAFSNTQLYTGTGNDLVFVAGTTSPLSVTNKGGNDTVFFGSGGSMAGINGGVTLHKGLGITGVIMDDSADNVSRTMTMDTGSGDYGWIEGLAPARISWFSTQTSSGGVGYVEVDGGSGGNAITIMNTSALHRGTKFITGAGNDTVNVVRTTGDLKLSNLGGNDSYIVGRAPTDTSGYLRLNTGSITIDNGGTVNLTVDNSADTVSALNVTLAGYTLTGLSSAPIYFGANGVPNLTIKGGNVGYVYNIGDNATDPSTLTTINTGSGNDIINVGGPSNKLDAIVGNFSISNGGGTDTLNVLDQASTSNNAYSLGANSFSRTGTASVNWTGVNTVNLKGGSGNDTYTLTGIPGAAVTITDAGGNDTLVGPDFSNAWSITGSNVVTLGTRTFTFAESLVGGSGDDTFAFQPGGQITGTLNGGSGGTDTIDESAWSDQIRLNLSNFLISGVGVAFANIEYFIGGTNPGNQFIGPNSDNTYFLSGTNNGYIGSFSQRDFVFSNFANFIGGPANDNFYFYDGATITGSIDGGGGVSNGIEQDNTRTRTYVDFAASKISGLGGTYSGLQWLTASYNAGGTVKGSDNGDTFAITVADNVILGGITLGLFNNIVAGAGDDKFVFSDGASLSGSINGGGGFNTLDDSAVTTPVVTNLTTNTTSGIGGTFANIQNVIAGSNTGNQLVGPNSDNTYFLSGTNNGYIGGFSYSNFAFRNFANFIGGPKNDNFYFYDGATITGSISGGGGLSNGIEQDNTTNPTNVNISTKQISNLGGTFSGLQWLTASYYVGGTVTGAPAGSKFYIVASNTVLLNGISLGLFNNLVGGAGNDLQIQ